MILNEYTKEINEHTFPRGKACQIADSLTEKSNKVYRVRYDNENGYQIVLKGDKVK